MQVVYALQDPPDSYDRSLFLAGPTPRTQAVASWRPQALRLLAQLGFDGVVYVPEDASGAFQGDYLAQLDWEEANLERADAIAFWVPRDMATMPALTTNVEFGRWYRSGKVVFGAPPQAPANRYLAHYADAPQSTLQGTLAAAVRLIGDGALRSGGERDVPAHIFTTPAFAAWYASQRAAGNTLRGAREQWTFRVGPRRTVFCFALSVDVWVAAEQRAKTNEFVLARPDIASVLLYQPAQRLDDVKVVLVREFRSPARNPDGFVWELPGGSSLTEGLGGAALASEEVREETGLQILAGRLRPAGSRQLAATFSAHHAHLFCAELSAGELAAACGEHGVLADGERTTVQVVSVGDIRRRELVDWSTLGMILSALA